jgi:RNA polymerase sigma-70 factor (ECF subfamily)
VATDNLRELAAAAAEGDDRAVAELVRRSQPAVWRVCAALGSDGEVDDLVQETYLRAVRALPGYRHEAPVLVWLLSIARRTCADHVRRRQRQRRLVERVAATISRTCDPVPPPASGAVVVSDLLEALDPDRREAFVLTQLAGLSYDEAAHVVGCPIGTIRSRVARARADLVALLDRADAAS